jgi:hypothetical protein
MQTSGKHSRDDTDDDGPGTSGYEDGIEPDDIPPPPSVKKVKTVTPKASEVDEEDPFAPPPPALEQHTKPIPSSPVSLSSSSSSLSSVLSASQQQAPPLPTKDNVAPTATISVTATIGVTQSEAKTPTRRTSEEKVEADGGGMKWVNPGGEDSNNDEGKYNSHSLLPSSSSPSSSSLVNTNTTMALRRPLSMAVDVIPLSNEEAIKASDIVRDIGNALNFDAVDPAKTYVFLSNQARPIDPNWPADVPIPQEKVPPTKGDDIWTRWGSFQHTRTRYDVIIIKGPLLLVDQAELGAGDYAGAKKTPGQWDKKDPGDATHKILVWVDQDHYSEPGLQGLYPKVKAFRKWWVDMCTAFYTSVVHYHADPWADFIIDNWKNDVKQKADENRKSATNPLIDLLEKKILTKEQYDNQLVQIEQKHKAAMERVNDTKGMVAKFKLTFGKSPIIKSDKDLAAAFDSGPISSASSSSSSSSSKSGSKVSEVKTGAERIAMQAPVYVTLSAKDAAQLKGRPNFVHDVAKKVYEAGIKPNLPKYPEGRKRVLNEIFVHDLAYPDPELEPKHPSFCYEVLDPGSIIQPYFKIVVKRKADGSNKGSIRLAIEFVGYNRYRQGQFTGIKPSYHVGAHDPVPGAIRGKMAHECIPGCTPEQFDAILQARYARMAANL